MNPFSIPVLCLTKNYIWHKNWNNGTNVFIFLNQKNSPSEKKQRDSEAISQ